MYFSKDISISNHAERHCGRYFKVIHNWTVLLIFINAINTCRIKVSIASQGQVECPTTVHCSCQALYRLLIRYQIYVARSDQEELADRLEWRKNTRLHVTVKYNAVTGRVTGLCRPRLIKT